MRGVQVALAGFGVSPAQSLERSIFQLWPPLMLLFALPALSACLSVPSAINTEYNLSSGDCLIFSDLNITINAANGTIVNNTTIIQNITSCPAANATLWANNTITLNNATITCLADALVINQTTIQNVVNTTIQNVSNITLNNCNLSMNITPSSEMQFYFNATQNSTIYVQAIPSNYCLENRVERFNETALVRSEKANNTFYFNAPACAACAVCPVCAELPVGAYALSHGENKSWGNLSASCAVANSCANVSTLDLFNGTDRAKVFVSVAGLNGQEETRAALAQDGDALMGLRTANLQSRADGLNLQINGPGGYTQQVQNLTAQVAGWQQGKNSNDGIYLALGILIFSYVGFTIWQKQQTPYFMGTRQQPDMGKMKKVVDDLGKAAGDE